MPGGPKEASTLTHHYRRKLLRSMTNLMLHAIRQPNKQTIKGINAHLILSLLKNLFIFDSAGGNVSQMDTGLGCATSSGRSSGMALMLLR